MRKFLPELTFEVVTDPDEIKASREQDARAKANSDWLQAHWADLLPQALGKFVIVAGQEAYIAESAKEAWDWAARVHPEDNGAIGKYVRPEKGPRLYGSSIRFEFRDAMVTPSSSSDCQTASGGE